MQSWLFWRWRGLHPRQTTQKQLSGPGHSCTLSIWMKVCAELHEYTAALVGFLHIPSAREIWECGRRIYSLPLYKKPECNLQHTIINILYNKKMDLSSSRKQDCYCFIYMYIRSQCCLASVSDPAVWETCWWFSISFDRQFELLLYKFLRPLHQRSAARVHFFKIMMTTRESPEIKISVWLCFIPNWHVTQWTQSKLVMTHSLLLSKTAFREMQLTHGKEEIFTFREALVPKKCEYVSIHW